MLDSVQNMSTARELFEIEAGKSSIKRPVMFTRLKPEQINGKTIKTFDLGSATAI
jgi:hypothetical protein